jgi:hypothetical protein
MRMPANPKPNKGIFDLHSKRTMMDPYSYRPGIFSDLFELKRRVEWVLTPNARLLAGQILDLRCKRSIGVPESLVGATDHGSLRVLPAWKSDLAWSINRRNRPSRCASLAIWLSHARALYSASHSARSSTSAGGAFQFHPGCLGCFSCKKNIPTAESTQAPFQQRRRFDWA